jgi:NAD(P)-dependent dehydrogenase (short-subunit alcohol dehydrogenase family)
MRLDGKVAVVTGGAKGLGRACAERFLSEGANVAIGDINEEELEATVEALGHAERLIGVECDVTRRADVETLVARAVDRFGRLDIMLNNAGIARSQDFLDITDQDFDDVLGVNLRGSFLGVQVAAKRMIEQGGNGVILNMSSVNALVANPKLATYAMSKGGINQLTTTAAVAFAPHRIRVVGIGPGTILTEMVAKAVFSSAEARNVILSRTPIGRCGEPSEVASVVAFLASDDASYITGQTIYPDGGRLILNYTVPLLEQ